MGTGSAIEVEDPLLPAARRRIVIFFVALTITTLVVLPAFMASIDRPGPGFVAALSAGQAVVIGLHAWWFRRSLRSPGTPAPRGYVVTAAVVALSVLSLGFLSGPLGSVWALGAAILLGDCVAGRPRRVVVPSVCLAVAVAFGLGLLLAPTPAGDGPNWISATIAALYTGVLWTASVNRLYWLGSMRSLDRSRRVGAELAVARERLRLADDLHDVLGHALEVVAFKSELAGTLLPPGASRARHEIDEVARVAREAMSEVRALARGRRTTTLVAELAGARAVLGSTGIVLSVTGDPTAVPAGSQDLLGRVLREAMTNLLRHSAAGCCSVTVTPTLDGTRLTVVNDGAGPDGAGAGQGTGLQGLRRYLCEHDGHLHAASGGDGTFTLTAELPARARTSA